MKFLVIFIKFIGICIAVIGIYLFIVYKTNTLLFALGLFLSMIGLVISILGFILEIIKPKSKQLPKVYKHLCPLCHQSYDVSQIYCIECGYTFKKEDIV